jgi:hypothetical protein
VNDRECPDISGTYDNVGLYASRNKMLFETGYLLSDFVFNDLEVVSYLEGVSISQPGANELRITISSKHNVYDAHSLSGELGDFICEDGKIWIAETVWGVHQLSGAQYGNTRIGLAKAEDGSLVGELQSSGVGVALVVIPMKWSSEDYVRWNRFDPEYWDAVQEVTEGIW